MTGGPMPWTALLEAIGEERLAEIRADLAARGTDDRDRNAFVLNGAVAAVLRELVPEDAPAEAVTSYAALLHLLYRCWTLGWPVATVSGEALRQRLSDPAHGARRTAHRCCYVQLPPLLVWASPGPGEPHEPLDGLFVDHGPDRLRVLAILGARAGRDGFTTLEADLPLPQGPPGPRPDGSPPFASVIPGGDLKQLISVVTPHELAALAWSAMASPADDEDA